MSKRRIRKTAQCFLIALFMFGSSQKAEANMFGKEETVIAYQYAYGDTCIEVVEVKVYFFLIVVDSYLD
ncbi:hypothetical protein [Arsenicibacter rosenii]|uniref:hypothetical protein n=1 Tax=Arsenicibacter rosenii TaxID=1750698 RepID=UPI0011600C7A|nr:hypothetical protein [Arsenicibacter rosenii]